MRVLGMVVVRTVSSGYMYRACLLYAYEQVPVYMHFMLAKVVHIVQTVLCGTCTYEYDIQCIYRCDLLALSEGSITVNALLFVSMVHTSTNTHVHVHCIVSFLDMILLTH